ncbi:two-component system sensor histidine kinase/response regulator [Bradyrhizobium jicamae]|uniref:histidine kinase n=1 Tax=Bradyrhizobium jicamae TaxID=280332 RepID=A0A0R3LJX4_9BRAD|nr:ATP-binding protein [Bradyrhizobium jicamae]KRR08044.1 two-component system sensor histidine kinase/response regulator [Bradyrhizobium jicamae]
MWAFFERLLDSSMFAPHGICLLWEPQLIWLHVASDVIIAAAYFSIPIALSIFVSKRRDVDFGWVFWAFALFIMACGVGHVMSIITLWYPVYGLEGIVKALTAAASIVTAAMLWPLLPKVLALPSPSQLRAAEIALAQEGMYRREAEDMLRQSQKMEAIGHLTGGVAHDFNNLLTIISGNLEIADRCLHSWSDATRERLTRVIANAANGAQRAAMLTQRLLAFARRQPLDPKRTNVNQLIAGMSDFFRRTLGETIDLEVAGGVDLWQVEVDPSQLEAAILNLVVNAKDAMNAEISGAMAGSGKLTIETRNISVDEGVQRNAGVPAGEYVLIAVSDTGSGMPREVQEKAFDPFFTTKEPGHGTGLGLSQVYGFVKQSGGEIKIYSEVGHGTAIRIYLPRAAAAPEIAGQGEGPLVGSSGSETVLVVEDECDVRSYLVETLKDLNYRVREAANGAAALALFDANPFRIDLLLTDIVMPGLNGRELADQLYHRQAGLRVLFMTGYSRDAIVHQGRLDPGVSLLQKPVTQALLAARIREILDKS